MAVPAPTQAELFAIIRDAVRISDNHLNQQTVPADAGTLEASAGGKTDFAAEILGAAASFETDVASAFSASAEELLRVAFSSYTHHQLNQPGRELDDALDQVYRDFDDNDERIQSRGIVFDKVGTPTGTGNIIIRRLVVDENGYPLDAHHADQLTFRVIGDAQTSAALRHRELWEAFGENAPRSLLGFGAESGSGLRRRQNLRTVAPADSLLTNADWSIPNLTDPDAPAAVTLALTDDLTGWAVIVGALTDISVDNTAVNIYRAEEAVSNPQSLIFNTNVTIEQSLNEEDVNTQAGVPFWRQLFVKRLNACDGAITVTVGDKVFAIADLTGVAAGVFVELVPLLDKDLWPANFNVPDPKFTIALTGRTVGELVLSTAILVPMIPLGGGFYSLMGGNTRSVLDDIVVFDDVLAGPEGKIARNLFLHAGRHLPAVPLEPQAAPTVALAGAGAGNVDDGTHVYAITFIDQENNESGAGARSAAVTVADKAVDGQVNVTVIPTGTANINSRRVYRTIANDDLGPLLLLTTIADNVTTVFLDNVADAGLGAAAPTGITLTDPV